MYFFNYLISNIFNFTVTILCYLPLILMAIIGIGFLIIFHEFGHFIFAKIFNVYTPSFSIGFGPRIIEKKIGETVFAISAIPLGGYVEMAGSPEIGQGEQTHAYATDERSFNKKPYWQKMIIISGGVLFNIIFAYLALTGLFYFGAPCIISSWCNKQEPIIEYVTPSSTADKSGLKAGDKILSINNISIDNVGNLIEKISEFPNKTVKLKIHRNNSEYLIDALVETISSNGKSITRIKGINWYVKPLSLKNSLVQAYKSTYDMISQIIEALKGLTKSREAIGGPIMLITQVTQCAGLGIKIFIFMLAFISINLAIFNIIPLPIFDGGQALFYTIEAISGKPLSEEIRYKIHYYTWIIVILLLIYLTYKDVIKIAQPYITKLNQPK